MKQLDSHLSVKVGSHLVMMKNKYLKEKKEQAQEIERLTKEVERIETEYQRKMCKQANKIERLEILLAAEDMELLVDLDNKEIWSDLKFLGKDKEMVKKYVKFLQKECYFERQEIPDCEDESSWVYENDCDAVLIWFIRNFSELKKRK